MVSGSWDGTLRLWDCCSGECLGTMVPNDPISPNETYTSPGSSAKRGVWFVGHTEHDQVVSIDYQATVRIWGTSNDVGRLLGVMRDQQRCNTATLVRHWDVGVVLATASSDAGTFQVWSLRERRRLGKEASTPPGVACLADLGEGLVLAAGMDKTLHAWEVSSGASIFTIPHHTGAAGSADIVTKLLRLRDGRLVTCSREPRVRVWS